MPHFRVVDDHRDSFVGADAQERIRRGELRRRRRTAPLPERFPAEEVTGDDHSERSARRAALQVALAGLAPRERELIALKFHAGLSNLDLARVLGVSESNAGTLLHRAITKLRKACDEQA